MGSRIEVVDNQLEVAFEALKKQSLRDGTFREMNRGPAYQKSSVKRQQKAAAARRKHRKAMRQREGDER
jgi:ribosomal protein S21